MPDFVFLGGQMRQFVALESVVRRFWDRDRPEGLRFSAIVPMRKVIFFGRLGRMYEESFEQCNEARASVSVQSCRYIAARGGEFFAELQGIREPIIFAFIEDDAPLEQLSHLWRRSTAYLISGAWERFPVYPPLAALDRTVRAPIGMGRAKIVGVCMHDDGEGASFTLEPNSNPGARREIMLDAPDTLRMIDGHLRNC